MIFYVFYDDMAARYIAIVFGVFSYLIKWHSKHKAELVGNYMAVLMGVLGAKYGKCEIIPTSSSLDCFGLFVPIFQIISI